MRATVGSHGAFSLVIGSKKKKGTRRPRPVDQPPRGTGVCSPGCLQPWARGEASRGRGESQKATGQAISKGKLASLAELGAECVTQAAHEWSDWEAPF